LSAVASRIVGRHVNILVFQHIVEDNGGSFLRLLPEQGAKLTVVNFQRGDAIPDIEAFDAMLVLGGPMDVWDIEECPWLVEEKRAIRHFVRTLQRPYLGLCLGHQLLADALGGTCGPQRPPQVGPFSISLTDEGKADPLFAGFPATFPAFKWHGVRVAQLPEGAVRLASSDTVRCEALRWGKRAFGVQFHPELTHGTLDRWYEIPGSPPSYIAHFGEGGLDSARAVAAPYIPQYEANAGQLVRNFLAIARD
jgi:GMP synthase-like glutamine amidotransferase